MSRIVTLTNMLFARGGRLGDLGSGFRGRRAQFDTNDLITGLAILTLLVLAGWAVRYIQTRQDGGAKKSRPLALFLELCRAHRLRFSDRWLLWRLARADRLRNPARLFLEPERFDPAGLPAILRLRARQLARIREKLFSETP